MSAADGASSSSDTVDVKVPKASAIAIHYPGYINNVDKAIETLGGEAVLFKALQDGSSFLKLRLRPEDQTSHPLFGERRDQQGLVLRISRPKGQPDAEPQVTVASRVTASYSFNGMADYQFLAQDSGVSSRDLSGLSDRNQPAAAEPFRTAQPFLLVPPIFSKVDMPVAFAFRDQALPKDSELELSSRKRIVSFYEHTLPAEVPLPADAYGSERGKQQLNKLKELLEERPAWPLELLLERIPGSTADSLSPALTALCYQFKTGPWKSLYLRCGFDPRASLDGRPYQLTAYRLPIEWNKAVKAIKAAGRGLKPPPLSKLLSFSAMPVHHTTYLQLLDLAQHDAALEQLLAGAPVPPGPSEAYGWFTYSSSQQLHTAVQMAFSKVLQVQLAELQQQLQQLEQAKQQQQDGAAEGQAAGAADGTGAEVMEVDGDAAAATPVAAEIRGSRKQRGRAKAAASEKQQQQQQKEDSTAVTAAAAAAAAAEEPVDGLVGLLGLGSARDELQEWLAEEAAAAEEHARQRGAAAADSAAAAASSGYGTSDGESTDAGGVSEGESDWGLTSGGETTADEATDGDEYEYDEYNEDV